MLILIRLFLIVALLWSVPFAAANKPTILVVGDSLSAGYGIDVHHGWVALLEQRLNNDGWPHRVINASISGDTTRAGLSRLPAALKHYRPEIVILELGANDGLRGLPLSEMKRNLATMIQQAKRQGAQVLLVGLRLPPNYGPNYTEKFHAIYRTLAQTHHTGLVPFLLAGVDDRPELLQDDQLHPRTEAQPLILDNIWPALALLLEPTAPALTHVAPIDVLR